MRHLKLWLCLLVLLTFGAGISIGLMTFASLLPRSERPFHQYEEKFVQTFNLSYEQTEYLRRILEAYQREEEAIKNDFVPAMEPQLRDLGMRIEAMVLRLLNEQQRADYAKLLESHQLFLPSKAKGG